MGLEWRLHDSNKPPGEAEAVSPQATLRISALGSLGGTRSNAARGLLGLAVPPSPSGQPELSSGSAVAPAREGRDEAYTGTAG